MTLFKQRSFAFKRHISAAALLALAATAASAQTGSKAYRDRNHNGRMDAYENPRLGIENAWTIW